MLDDRCMDMCIDMCVDVCKDMCMDMCVDVCKDMCTDMCIGRWYRHVCRRVQGNVHMPAPRRVSVAPNVKQFAGPNVK